LKINWQIKNFNVYLSINKTIEIMAKYYEVQVTMHHEIDNGKGVSKIKKTKENYLVDAMSVTEAEARVVKLFTDSAINVDYEVTGAKESKIIEVVTAE